MALIRITVKSFCAVRKIRPYCALFWFLLLLDKLRVFFSPIHRQVRQGGFTGKLSFEKKKLEFRKKILEFRLSFDQNCSSFCQNTTFSPQNLPEIWVLSKKNLSFGRKSLSFCWVLIKTADFLSEFNHFPSKFAEICRKFEFLEGNCWVFGKKPWVIVISWVFCRLSFGPNGEKKPLM